MSTRAQRGCPIMWIWSFLPLWERVQWLPPTSRHKNQSITGQAMRGSWRLASGSSSVPCSPHTDVHALYGRRICSQFLHAPYFLPLSFHQDNFRALSVLLVYPFPCLKKKKNGPPCSLDAPASFRWHSLFHSYLSHSTFSHNSRVFAHLWTHRSCARASPFCSFIPWKEKEEENEKGEEEEKRQGKKSSEGENKANFLCKFSLWHSWRLSFE